MAQTPVGHYIVTDPRICHGKPTFRGTRIMVSQVLEQIASGMAWEAIEKEWHGKVSAETIAATVCLDNKAFVEHNDDSLGLT